MASDAAMAHVCIQALLLAVFPPLLSPLAFDLQLFTSRLLIRFLFSGRRDPFDLAARRYASARTSAQICLLCDLPSWPGRPPNPSAILHTLLSFFIFYGCSFSFSPAATPNSSPATSPLPTPHSQCPTILCNCEHYILTPSPFGLHSCATTHA